MGQSYVEEYNRIRKELTQLNTCAKREMLMCLAKIAGKEDIDKCAIGFETHQNIGNDGTEVIMRFNCCRNGAGSERVGAGINELTHYRWIPVVCRVGEETYNYRIDFLCQDIDTKTGNFHIDTLGELQIWGGLINNSTSEVGGSVAEVIRLSSTSDKESGEEILYSKGNEKVKRVEHTMTNENGEYYLLNRFAKSFPPNIKEKKKEYKNPWGHEAIDSPILDMADDGFDMPKAADFFWRLIVMDIESEITKSKSG